VTSSTGSSYRFTLDNGTFHGTGGGTIECYEAGSTQPDGLSDPSTLTATLTPASKTQFPATTLTGTVHLAAPGGHCDAGTGDFHYVLKRTGDAPSQT
jgi:hypothetical protein